MSRKPTYEELERKNNLIEALINNSQLGTIQLTVDNIVTEVNPEFTRIFGYEPFEVIGHSIDPVLTSEEDRKEAEILSKQTKKGETIHVITKRKKKDGTLIDVEIFCGPVKSEW